MWFNKYFHLLALAKMRQNRPGRKPASLLGSWHCLEVLEDRSTPSHLGLVSPLSGSASWDIGLDDGSTVTKTVTGFPIDYQDSYITVGVHGTANPAVVSCKLSLVGSESPTTANEFVSVRGDWKIVADANEQKDDPVQVNVTSNPGGLDNVLAQTAVFDNGIIKTSDYGQFLAHIGDSISISEVLSRTDALEAANGEHEVRLSLSPLPPSVSVSTPDSLATTGPTFGPYLPGVSLSAPFTVSVSDPSHQVSSIKWTISGTGGGGGVATKKNSSTWTFTENVGQLAAGSNHTLIVTAYNGAGKAVGDPFTGTVSMTTGPLSLAVKAAYPGGDPLKVTDLRFINGPALNETFTGTIAGMPDYYKNSQLQVYLDTVAVSSKVTPLSIDGNLGFQFTTNVGAVAVGSPGITARVGTQPITKFGAQPEKMLVVKEPGWLNKSKLSFLSGAYVFNGVAPAVALMSVKTPAITSIPWLSSYVNGKTNSFSLTPNFNVKIPVVKAQDATVAVNSLTANLTLLGKDVWKQVYSSSAVEADLKLDPNLQPTDLKLTVTSVPQTIETITFLDRKFTVPIHTLLTPAVTITASLGLKVIGNLAVQGAGVEMTWAGSQLAWVPDGTFIQLLVTAKGSVSAEGTAVVAGGWLGTYSASGRIDAILAISGKAELGGLITRPVLVAPSLKGTLLGSYYYSFDGFLGITKPKATEEVQKDQPDGTFPADGQPVTLFVL